LQLAASFYTEFAAPAWASEPWAIWVLTFVPLYCVGIPAGLLIMRRVPPHRAADAPFGTGRFLSLLPMCLFLMYAGNLVGVLITSLISSFKGSEVSNPLESYAMGDASVVIKVLVMVILAPLAEEFIFRRVLIDRMRIYGEKTAVATSALMFGLFHGNLSQFFYAAALGALFGYVYVRTGRLRYSAGLHIGVNALGSVVAPWLLQNAGIDELSALDSSTLLTDPEALSRLVTPGLLLFLLYGLLLIVFSILGLVLLCINLRRLTFVPAERELPREGRVATVWCNVGMILLVVSCLGMIVFSTLI
jgi:membrane protease YdiL (CAAX protease family)